MRGAHPKQEKRSATSKGSYKGRSPGRGKKEPKHRNGGEPQSHEEGWVVQARKPIKKKKGT